MTPLMKASWDGNIPEVQNLLENPDNNVNEQNNTGKTAIMFAAYQNHAHVVDLLLCNKADFFVWDHAGGNAFTSGITGKQNRLLDRFALSRQLESGARKTEMDHIREESCKITDSIDKFDVTMKAWRSMRSVGGQ